MLANLSNHLAFELFTFPSNRWIVHFFDAISQSILSLANSLDLSSRYSDLKNL